jgi:hypothetical protein
VPVAALPSATSLLLCPCPQDVRYVRGPKGMVVELAFGSNPYFSNKVRGRRELGGAAVAAHTYVC